MPHTVRQCSSRIKLVLDFGGVLCQVKTSLDFLAFVFWG